MEQNHLFEQTKVVERNQYLKLEGTTDTQIYFIDQGCLKFFVFDGEVEQIIRFGYQNDLVAALDSFLSEKPSPFYIQAIRKTVVKIISKQKFVAFMQSDTAYLHLWIKILENLVLQQIEREKDLLIASPKERYNRVLERSPSLFQEVPHKYIANYLRMSAETLSRLKNLE